MTNELKLVEDPEPRIETQKILRFEYKEKEHNITINQIGEEYLLMVNCNDFVLMNRKQLSALWEMIEQSLF